MELADARATALKLTQGDLFRQLYSLSEIIIADDCWVDKMCLPDM
ncbi:hypothetical protein QA641_38110 [Bradyrhizobium sp. CB1650]|nr:hypothetical protein [Bradyrhizobium sp. CB1650]WGD51243.1 hypothetical protein QA641_38110 [Bradyrhizobium sp. CB1650]